MLYRGDTPLHLAAAGLRYDAARALLAASTPVNAVNRRGATSLHYACDPRPLSPTWDPGAQRRIIELLVSAGATVDQPDRGGVTPLHRAVRARSPAAVATLLSAGADPHAATSKAGSTPLHLAVAPTGASGTAGAGDLQLEIVRMLLAAGATMADVDRNSVAVADRIQSQALRDALAAGQLLSESLRQPAGNLPATRPARPARRRWPGDRPGRSRAPRLAAGPRSRRRPANTNGGRLGGWMPCTRPAGRPWRSSCHWRACRSS
jgi:ankyrin repeat protein